MKLINKIITLLKKNLILLFAVWLIIAIIIIPALSLAIVQGSVLASPDIDASLPFVGNLTYFISNPFLTLGYIFNPRFFGTYLETLKNFTGIYFLLVVFLAASAPIIKSAFLKLLRLLNPAIGLVNLLLEVSIYIPILETFIF